MHTLVSKFVVLNVENYYIGSHGNTIKNI